MKKILFVHNTIPEYRLKFWEILNQSNIIEIFALSTELADKIYNLEKNLNSLKIKYAKDISIDKILAESFDIVILPAIDTWKEFCASRVILSLKKKYNYKTIYWSEKWEADWYDQPFRKKIKNLIHRKLISYVATRCNLCIASGMKSLEYLLMLGIRKEKIQIAVDSSTSPKNYPEISIRNDYGINDQKIILFMGRLVSRKGCQDLIQAFQYYIKYQHCILLIAGDGPEYSVCTQLADNNKKIIFTGLVQPMNRRFFYEQADVFVLPSRCEGGVIEAWGLTVNEALECGVPVVVSDVVGAGYDLIDSNNGVIFRNGNIEELAKAIDYVLNKDYDKNKIIRNYMAYSVENMAHTFSNAFKNCF
jgi:glycosyltransferase involved in cell wall biosynthesis